MLTVVIIIIRKEKTTLVKTKSTDTVMMMMVHTENLALVAKRARAKRIKPRKQESVMAVFKRYHQHLMKNTYAC